LYTSDENIVMKAKQKFNTGGALAVKPFLRRSRVVLSSPKSVALLVIVLSSLLVVSCNSGPKGSDNISEAVAKVGSRDITLKQVDSAIKQQLDASGGGSLTPVELVAARMTVLDTLIQTEVLYQKAQKENLVPDDNKVNQEVQRRKQEANLTEDQYKAQIQQAGLTEEELRDKIRREIAINELRARENSRVSAPTDAEIEKYYNDHKDEFKAERGVDISVIAVSPANNAGEAGAEQKIRGIYAQLRSGSDFATVASQKSEEQQSAIRGGRLGFASEAGLKQSFAGIPDINTRLMTLSEGQYTEPIRDNSGNWYIFKLNLKREKAENLTLNDVRADITNAITQQRQQVLWNALGLVAMNEAGVKNYLAVQIVENPQTIVEMRPSQLLEQSARQQQQQPRFENNNQAAPVNSNASRPTSSNANTAARSGNSRPPTANANR
jgi:parvulin-like peptidyl-prolyl isomerase